MLCANAPIHCGIDENAEVGVPYPGAKPRYILDIDHASYACRVIATLWEHIT